MKLIIQIPCYNEEKSLPVTLEDLPKKIDGINRIETLIINDGSNDKTIEVAKANGVDHIVSFKNNKGLARAFAEGIEKSLELGADIIVNTDADNQYYGKDIVKLVKPIVDKRADVVIGDRQINKIPHFSWTKKKLQILGSGVIRKLINLETKDVVSGFRAYSREAALRINILSEFSYTVENLIQLQNQKFKIISVPVRTNKKLRESRLFRKTSSFITSQLATLMRIYTAYKALKVFTTIGLLIILPGIFGFMRFLYFYFINGTGKGHIQSLIFSTILVNVGFLVLMFGIIADLINNNRKLIEKILYILKKRNIE